MRFFYIFLLFFGSFFISNAEEVLVIKVDGGIGPGVTNYIENSIAIANEKDYEALIIELDTPGGLLEATRDIVEKIMGSETPVIVYVSPSGARAGSAGVFITMAAHIAVMAPGTNIGAAHPVSMGGQSDTTDMFKKITNDAAAFIRTIAQKRDRNQEWAEQAVRESISSTAEEALEAGAIDLIASGIDSLLKSVDSTEVETEAGIFILNTKDAKIVRKDKNWRESLLTLISDPNIAYIFLMVGFYGILFELYSPGSIFPGALGAISILIAAYSMQMLPLNYVGLGLILLSFVLFILEIYVTSYGLLSIGGAVSILLGSIMLVDSPVEFMDISLSLIITVTILTLVFFVWVVGSGIKAQFREKAPGGDNFEGETGVAMNDIEEGKYGNIKLHGEIWKAEALEKIKKGDSIQVAEMKGLKLKVRKK